MASTLLPQMGGYTVVNLGYIGNNGTQTVDIKQYTDKWASLTRDNFFLDVTAAQGGKTAANGYITFSDATIKSYAAGTGLLTVRFPVYHWPDVVDMIVYGNVYLIY